MSQINVHTDLEQALEDIQCLWADDDEREVAWRPRPYDPFDDVALALLRGNDW